MKESRNQISLCDYRCVALVLLGGAEVQLLEVCGVLEQQHDSDAPGTSVEFCQYMHIQVWNLLNYDASFPCSYIVVHTPRLF